jgi:hypothetical protein
MSRVFVAVCYTFGPLQSENLSQLALDRELARGGHAAVSLQDVLSGEFYHEMPMARGLVFESVRRIEEHFVRVHGPVGWPNRAAQEAVQISEIGVVREPIGRAVRSVKSQDMTPSAPLFPAFIR